MQSVYEHVLVPRTELGVPHRRDNSQIIKQVDTRWPVSLRASPRQLWVLV